MVFGEWIKWSLKSQKQMLEIYNIKDMPKRGKKSIIKIVQAGKKEKTRINKKEDFVKNREI